MLGTNVCQGRIELLIGQLDKVVNGIAPIMVFIILLLLKYCYYCHHYKKISGSDYRHTQTDGQSESCRQTHA